MEFTPLVMLLILGVGLAAGFVAGFVGVGGGIIMVPVLLELFRAWGVPDQAVVQAAMGTSLGVAVFSVSSAIIRHGRQKRVFWRLVPFLAPGSLIGGWLAARLAAHLPGTYLQLGLAGLMAVAAVRLLTENQPGGKNHRHIRWWQGSLVGLGVGLVAGFSGLAGGVVLVPALALLLGLPTGWLAGTSSAVIIFSSLAAALGYLTADPAVTPGAGFTGFVALPIVGLLAVSAVPAAQLGAWTNRRVRGIIFRRIFAVLMFLVVVRLVFKH